MKQRGNIKSALPLVTSSLVPIPLLALSLMGALGCGANESGVRASGTNAGSSGSTAGSTTGIGGSTSTAGDTTTTTAGVTGGVVIEDPGVPETPEECPASEPGEPLLRRLTARELLNSQAAVFPSAAASAVTTLPPDLQGAIRLTNDADTLMMGSQMAEAVLARAEEIATVVTSAANLSAALPCAATAPDAACAAEFINANGSALFRRPITDTERARYEALFTSISGRSDFATGLKWVLVGLIQSPFSVYRSELGQAGQLTAREIASELSYNYSARPPTAELLALADSGGLADPAVRFTEAQKLLASSGGQEVVQQFFSEWLWLSQVGSVNRANAPENFPTIRSKMLLETQRFISDVLYTRQGTLADLLTANYTVADADLSAYYGFAGGSGDIFSGGGVEVPRTQGIGLFAQGAVLTSMASVAITSPTRRGLLILKRLFCEVPEPPEALNFDLTSDLVSGNTTRERLENSHLQGPCQTCHANFDPFGFAFENFDHIGRYRTEEVTANGSFPINASTSVEKLEGQVVNGQVELMNALIQSPEMLSCVSATFERYVYGSDGSCRAKDARAKFLAGEVSVLDFLADLAREPHFASRN